MPLPDHLDASQIIERVLPSKDIDGLHPHNVGKLAMHNYTPDFIACTPLGIMELLDQANVSIEGKVVVVVGRGNLVGNPLSMLLNRRDATVIQCHVKTKNMEQFIKQADIVVSACGVPEIIQGSWLKDDCVVVDAGINFIKDHPQDKKFRMVGDVSFEDALNVASVITPVPGGVGPMTVAMLLQNVTKSFKLRNQL